MSPATPVFQVQPLVSGRKTLNPGGDRFHIHSRSDVLLTADEWDDMERGARHLFYFGEIKYWDTFDDRHTAKFRMWYAGEHLMGLRRLALCEDGNESD
jgi:hypothetical protein